MHDLAEHMEGSSTCPGHAELERGVQESWPMAPLR